MEVGEVQQGMGPLLILAIVLFAGAAGGTVAKRFRAPGVTGNIIVGVLLALTIFRDKDIAQLLQPISTFAISLIAVTAGGHFSYRRLHNSIRRVLFIGVAEVAGAVLLVIIAVRIFDPALSWPMVLILGCLAASTAPATTVALIRESRAKGPFVKTLVASVVVDSSLCILLFAFMHSLLRAHYAEGSEAWEHIGSGILNALRSVVFSGMLGIAIGAVVTRLFAHERFHDFSTMLLSILTATGCSYYFDFSPLLTCLFLGAYLGNSSPRNEQRLDALEPIEPLLYTAFFTLAGIGIHFEMLEFAGLIAVVYAIARGLGKALGAWAGAKAAGCSPRIVRSIPFGFVPQAGVALGLVVILSGDPLIPAEDRAFISTLILAAVTLNEIVGPFITRFALQRARETGLDRPRLVEFLEEEYILPQFEARDRWDALEKLVDFYALTHRVDQKEKEQILQTVLKREREHTTALGLGAALPHGHVPHGRKIQGVMAISQDGIAFDAPDGQLVHIIVLIVTPADHETRHLEVLATLSNMVSEPKLRARLLAATDANEAWEILEDEETRDFNYFLEENGNGVPQRSEST